jgi:hypothetical protein
LDWIGDWENLYCWGDFSSGEYCNWPFMDDTSVIDDEYGKTVSILWSSSSWRYSVNVSRAFVKISIRSVKRWNSLIKKKNFVFFLE